MHISLERVAQQSRSSNPLFKWAFRGTFSTFVCILLANVCRTDNQPPSFKRFPSRSYILLQSILGCNSLFSLSTLSFKGFFDNTFWFIVHRFWIKTSVVNTKNICVFTKFCANFQHLCHTWPTSNIVAFCSKFFKFLVPFSSNWIA